MNRGADRQSVEVMGPDEHGIACPMCLKAAVVRRHFVYRKRGKLIFARTDWCRSCSREVPLLGHVA